MRVIANRMPGFSERVEFRWIQWVARATMSNAIVVIVKGACVEQAQSWKGIDVERCPNL